jgi:hypothetical protein
MHSAGLELTDKYLAKGGCFGRRVENKNKAKLAAGTL